jgi:hypothetical protein
MSDVFKYIIGECSMKISVIAKATGYSNAHTRRLAVAGDIPGCKKTKGGHYFFPDTMALRQWIGRQKNKKVTRRLKAQARAEAPARHKRAHSSGTGRISHNELVLFQSPAWYRNLFLEQLDSASAELLEHWRDYLRAPYLAYLEVERRLVEIQKGVPK